MASTNDLSPAVAAPSGFTSNLINPDDRHCYTIVTVTFSLLVTLPLVVTRLLTKIYLHHHTDPEDWLLIAAQLSFVAFLALLLALPTQGAHEWDVTRADANRFAFLVNILEFIYIIPLLLSKIALILQIKRIFTAGSTIRNFIYWVLQTIIGMNLLVYAALIIWAIVFITHQSQDYDPACTGECHNGNYALVATGIFNAVVDLVTICVPLWAVRSLQMSLWRKLGVAAVFGVGALACAASILRAAASFAPIDDEVDQTYTSFPVFYWGAAEIAAVIAATCVPCLPKLWKAIYERYLNDGRGDLVVDYPLYERRAEHRSKTALSTTVTWPGVQHGGRNDRVADHEDLAANGEVALLQDRMRGLGVGMGTTQRIEGGLKLEPEPERRPWSRRQSVESTARRMPRSRQSMESGLREMPVRPAPPMPPSVSRRSSGGILKTVEIEVQSRRI